MVNVRLESNQDQSNKFEWLILPVEYRTQDSIIFDQLVRSGGICSIEIIQQVSEAIREISQDLKGAALATHGFNIGYSRPLNIPEDQ